MMYNEKEYDVKLLMESMPTGTWVEPHLKGALKYALETEGSHSRARLTYAISQSVGLNRKASQSLATGIELFHLASLVLDDLPCMDNADTRRAQTCVHRVYDESTAILASLGFINRGYALMWSAFAQAPAMAAQEAANIVEQCLGIDGLINGQAMDLSFEAARKNEDLVETIAHQKTGSLFRLCMLLPAVLAEASRYEKMQLASLSDCWGVAYQVADDLKDVLFGEEVSGKSSQKDEMLGRPNMALQAGTEGAMAKLRFLMDESNAIIKSMISLDAEKWTCLELFQGRFLEKAETILSKEQVA